MSSFLAISPLIRPVLHLHPVCSTNRDIMADNLVLLYCCMALGCEKAYNNKFNLKRHVNCRHSLSRQHCCDLCKRQFASHQNLVEHQYLHSGKKPFACSVCRQSFRQASQLSLHKKLHCMRSQVEVRDSK